MVTKAIKSKFRIGQKVWYIANGYVSSGRIEMVFNDKYDCMCYSMQRPILSDEKYTVGYELVKGEDSLYSTKEALIKSIKDTQDDE